MVTGMLVGLAAGVFAARANLQAGLQEPAAAPSAVALAPPHARRRWSSPKWRSRSRSRSAPGCCCAASSRVMTSIPASSTEHLLTLQMNIPQRLTTPTRGALLRASSSRASRRCPAWSRSAAPRACRSAAPASPPRADRGQAVPVAELPEVQFRRAMHNYFEAMGIPIRRGRGFTADDGPTAPPVVVINETMARRVFGTDDPIGQHMRTGPNPTGPVDDDRRRDRRHPPRRPRSGAAAGAVHQLPAGPAGGAVHRRAHRRRSGGAGRTVRAEARASTRPCRSTTSAR